MERNLLAFILVSLTWKGCLSVMCYWCSGVGDDRECEVRPYAVRTGPVYLNCRANFCLSAKVIDADSGRVMSFARLCDNVPRGNLCIRDSKLLTCYESCTSDLCNNGNPSPLQLPTVNYAGEEILPRTNYYKDNVRIRAEGTLGRSLLTNSLKGAMNSKSGPKRDMWQAATQQSRRKNTQTHKSPFNVMSSTDHEGKVTKNHRNPHHHGVVKKAMFKDDQVVKNKHSTTVHAPTLSETPVDVIPFTSENMHEEVESVTPVPTIAKKENQPLVYSDAPVTVRVVNRNIGNGNEVRTKLRKKQFNSTYNRSSQPNGTVTNKRQTVKNGEAKLVFEEDFEAAMVGDIARKVNDVMTLSRGTSTIREELDYVRSEDEKPVSSLAVQEEGEAALIQTFRANTTKTTADTAGVTLKGQQKENILFSTNGSTTVKNGRVITYRQSKKTTAAPVSTIRQQVAFSTTAYRSLSSMSTTSGKTTTTLPLRRSNRSQTTLPYIWKEKSSWNDDGTLNDKITTVNKSSHTTERKEHPRTVSLTDLLELQSTSHKVTTHGPSVPNDDDDIYLKQPLTENLHGAQGDILDLDQTKAGFTGSRATVVAGGKLMLSIALSFMYLPIVYRH